MNDIRKEGIVQAMEALHTILPKLEIWHDLEWQEWHADEKNRKGESEEQLSYRIENFADASNLIEKAIEALEGTI